MRKLTNKKSRIIRRLDKETPVKEIAAKNREMAKHPFKEFLVKKGVKHLGKDKSSSNEWEVD